MPVPELPTPIALLVGDFTSGDGHFAASAWALVKRAYESGHRPYGPTVDPQLDAKRGAFKRIPNPDSAQLRNEATTLLPVAFNDFGNASGAFFREQLHRAFLTYDVWCVIACTTSKNTPYLVRALDFIDVPILLTVDSALNSGLDRQPNILRLMPNNVQQAQAIVAKVVELHNRDPKLSSLEVFFYPAGDRYVADLTSALRAQSRGGPRDPLMHYTPEIKTTNAYIAKRGLLVCCGYRRAFDESLSIFEGKRGTRFLLVLSDGCYGSEGIEKSVRQLHRKHPKTRVFVSHSLYTHTEYALHAYTAACDAWRVLGRRSTWEAAGHRPAAETLYPYVRRIEELLVNNFGGTYYFQGMDNQRGSYVVDELDVSVHA